MLYAGTSSTIGIIYFIILNEFNINYIYYSYNVFNNKVKMIMTWGQSAVVNIYKRYIATQRLNARDLMNIYILGLLEGDGYFSVNKKGKYIMYNIGIELSIKDIKLLYKIKKHLGVGTIIIRKSKVYEEYIETAIYRIKDKNHIKNIIIPLIDKYPLFTNKYYDYLYLKNCICSKRANEPWGGSNNNLIFYDTLTEYKRPNEYLQVENILKSYHFPIWLIGFIEAEGYFSIYKTKHYQDVACFEISQSNNFNIIEAIKIYFEITSKVYKDKTNNFIIKTTSSKCIQNVINKLHKTPIKLQGLKKVNYLIFLNKLRQIPRYKDKLIIPNIY